jgi:hypothetical protein
MRRPDSESGTAHPTAKASRPVATLLRENESGA